MRIVNLLIVLVLLAQWVTAQDSATVDSKLRTRIIEVLDATAVDARKWNDKTIAARTQAQIADLVWDTNPDNGNTYLSAAWATSAKIEEPRRERSTFVNPSLRNAVRREILLVARRRAPELAATWLEELVQESKTAEQKERGTFDDRSARSAVLLQMAQQLVDDNPPSAAELLIESLRDGISFNFQTILIRIFQKDPVLAEKVFRAALEHLRINGLNDPNELLTLYAYLYTPGRVFGANTSDNRNQVQLALGGARVAVPPARQNPTMALAFLELAADLLLSAPVPEGNNAQMVARALVSTIGTLLREVTQQLPDKAAWLRARAQQLDAEARFSPVPAPRRTDMPEIRPGESQESIAERRVDLLEEAAAKGRDSLTRDIGYAKAAEATTVERYERGLDLTSKIEEKNLREGVRNLLIYRAVLHLIAAGKFVEAHSLNLRNESVVQRAVCLVVGAQRFVKEKATDRAGEWLREAGVLVRKSEPSEDIARVALGISESYGRFDLQSAFEWLVDALKVIRKASVTSLNDDHAPSLKHVSGITSPTNLNAGTSGFSLQSAVAVFPREQFDDVLYQLNDLTPPETRGLAIVTLCRGALRSIKK